MPGDGFAGPTIDLTDDLIHSQNEEIDQTAVVQAAIDRLADLGGGSLEFPSGRFIVSGLTYGSEINFKGQGVGITVLELPTQTGPGQHFMFAPKTFLQNKTYGSNSVSFSNMTFRGNRSHGPEHPSDLLVLRGTRYQIKQIQFENSSRHAVSFFSRSRDGTVLRTSVSGNKLINNTFKGNLGAAIFGKENNANRLADMRIVDNVFSGNGDLGFFQVDLERSSGFFILNNKFFNAPYGDVRALKAGGFFLRGNHFNTTRAKVLEPARCVCPIVVSTPYGGGYGSLVISDNIVHNHLSADDRLHHEDLWKLMSIRMNNQLGVAAVSGNVFMSNSLPAIAISVSGQFANRVNQSGNARSLNLR